MKNKIIDLIKELEQNKCELNINFEFNKINWQKCQLDEEKNKIMAKYYILNNIQKKLQNLIKKT